MKNNIARHAPWEVNMNLDEAEALIAILTAISNKKLYGWYNCAYKVNNFLMRNEGMLKHMRAMEKDFIVREMDSDRKKRALKRKAKKKK